MNGINAAVFALIGAGMEIVPRLLPSWFPPTGGDESSARALWLFVMGVTQMALAAGYVFRTHVMPFTLRVVSTVRATERTTLALAHTRSVSGH
ncbi:MAG TPA: hypothetical protein VGG37_03060 [Opitutaceae bacterium]|jgi:hypothetical protein